MSVILVVEQDASRAERISAALRREGLSVMTVGSRAEALSSAQRHPPGLMVASAAVPEVSALLEDFSRRRGGPGAVVVVEDSTTASELEGSADEVLTDSYSDEDLRELVQRCLKMPDPPSGDELETSESEQLTSADIFGDVLAEVEAEVSSTGSVPAATAKSSRPLGDIERRLEETLSGVLPIAGKAKRPSVAETAQAPDKTRKIAPPTDREIDDLLDQTLSSLDIPTRSKKPPSSALPSSAAGESLASAPEASEAKASPTPSAPTSQEEAHQGEFQEEPLAGRVADAGMPTEGSTAVDSLSGVESSPAPTALEAPAWDPEAPAWDAADSPASTSDPDGDEFIFNPEDLDVPDLPEIQPPTAKKEDTFAGAGFVPLSPPDPVSEPSGEIDWQERATPVDLSTVDGPADTDATPLASEMASEQSPVPPGAWSVLENLPSDGDHFRTQAMSTFDLAAAAAEHKAALNRDAASDPYAASDPHEDVEEMPVSDGEAFGEYTLLDRIAVGGMAEVWRARRRGVEGFRKTVAIKKILSHLTGSPDFVTMFIDEAKLAAQLSHNNIIQIYDLGKVGEDFFIAMEHVDGKDLRSILTAAQELSRPIPLGLSLQIISAVAQALEYAHRKRDFDGDAMGLVHRDVSPQNVMISYEGAIKLCDFGIVKAVSKASTTQMGALKGKLQYMSPEQAWGKSVDARSDIFSLGSVLYEVLTGTQLFTGESEIGVLDAVRECKIESPRTLVPEIPEEVANIALRALAKSPEERFQTAGEFEQEIRAALDDLRPTPSQKDLAGYLCGLFDIPKTGAVAITAASSAITSPTTASGMVPGATADSSTAGSSVSAVSSPESFASATSPTAAAPISPPVVEPAPEEATKAEVATAPTPKESASRSGAWKWLVAAVLAIVLIGVGFLTLPSLLRPKSSSETPPSAAPPAREEAEVAAPDVSPAPLEDAGLAAAEDPTREEASGEAPAAAARSPQNPETGLTDEDPADADSGVAASGIDIEQLVNEELTNRAEQLRRDFEAERERIEKELARAQKENQPTEESQEGGDGVPP